MRLFGVYCNSTDTTASLVAVAEDDFLLSGDFAVQIKDLDSVTSDEEQNTKIKIVNVVAFGTWETKRRVCVAERWVQLER
mmetsp:Transcript_5996/g.9297  ORF Transcript_5996/g.9297 Transcript_5996/m.9297 type:complete len:80 (+) Transcript_5996:371-610(+)